MSEQSPQSDLARRVAEFNEAYAAFSAFGEANFSGEIAGSVAARDAIDEDRREQLREFGLTPGEAEDLVAGSDEGRLTPVEESQMHRSILDVHTPGLNAVGLQFINIPGVTMSKEDGSSVEHIDDLAIGLNDGGVFAEFLSLAGSEHADDELLKSNVGEIVASMCRRAVYAYGSGREMNGRERGAEFLAYAPGIITGLERLGVNEDIARHVSEVAAYFRADMLEEYAGLYGHGLIGRQRYPVRSPVVVYHRMLEGEEYAHLVWPDITTMLGGLMQRTPPSGEPRVLAERLRQVALEHVDMAIDDLGRWRRDEASITNPEGFECYCDRIQLFYVTTAEQLVQA